MDEAEEFCNKLSSSKDDVTKSANSTTDEGLLTLNNFIDELNEELNGDEWRYGSMESKNRHYLDTGVYSDIKFMIGPDNNTQIINAHKIMLARASPVFEAMFNDSTLSSRALAIRVTDMSTGVFKTLLEYIYTGTTCFSTFDEACEMLNVASRLQMPDLAKFCHYHLWINMYPNNVWSAYQCAVAANDTFMTNTALSIVQRKTDEALMNSAFTKIPRSTLVSFLQNDHLTVTSELILFQASLRWAMAEAERQGLPQEPESLRACLGPALQHIRFLTLTPTEFTNMQYNSKLLSYSESLAVIFNLNVPGVMHLPKNLSSNKNKRNIENTIQYFEVLEKPSNALNCESSNPDLNAELNILDAFTTSVLTNESFRVEKIRSITVPRRQSPLCPNIDDEFTVYVFGPEQQLLHTEHFKTNCLDETLDENFYLVYFSKDVSISEQATYTIKITFHKPGRYPFSLGIGDGQFSNRNWGSYEWKLGENNFVYSIRNK